MRSNVDVDGFRGQDVMLNTHYVCICTVLGQRSVVFFSFFIRSLALGSILQFSDCQLGMTKLSTYTKNDNFYRSYYLSEKNITKKRRIEIIFFFYEMGNWN